VYSHSSLYQCASPRDLTNAPDDVRPEIYFLPSQRARVDELSSRLDVLRAAYRRACALRGLAPLPGMQVVGRGVLCAYVDGCLSESLQAAIDAVVLNNEPLSVLALTGTEVRDGVVQRVFMNV
jgi:hypothetical protein